jgi:calcineurin-like phosphoesterase family protein
MMKLWTLLAKHLGNDRCKALFGARTFCTSDLHFGHENILKYCPLRGQRWATPAEMGPDLVQLWNDTVRPWDVVYVLGDMCMGKIDESLKFVGQLHGVKHLVTGNHDRCGNTYYFKPNYSKQMLWVQKYLKAGFTSITDGSMIFRFDFHGHQAEVQMCHFPFKGDSTGEERHPDARPGDTGRILLHGHVHDAFKARGRMVNVGVDVHNFRPVRIEKLYKLALADDHHDILL